MNKLTRLTINKFRNVKPTTLEFRPGINVVLGKNAAGKTTLLRLLSTLLGTFDEPVPDESLDTHISVTGDTEFEQSTLRKRLEEPTLPLNIGHRERSLQSSFHQTDALLFKHAGKSFLKADLKSNEVALEAKDLQIRAPRGPYRNPILSIFSILSADRNKNAPFLSRMLMDSYVKTAGRMDESLESFNELFKIEGHLDVPSGKWIFDALPFSMVDLSFAPAPEGNSTNFSFPFLDRTAVKLGYDSATARFDVERFNLESGRHTVRLSNLKFFFRRADEEVSHEWLSYGQKRLLAFFAHVDASPDIVIADELVNGLHHEWISACLDEISDRQAFLTSQNPLLLDFLRFESLEEVRHTFIICERTGSAADAQLIWRNLTEDEAESFFLAYQTGIQRVSDILLTKGLW
ncbi:AAA family ATPase [Corallococcus exercitus]|uniref:AAA family ATPase n=1 Tax=Corallococcus exercitus TaxID=2316736 RepID=UPI0035D3F06B